MSHRPPRWGLTVPLAGVPLADHGPLLKRAEEVGYADLWSGESATGADGFTPLALAATATKRMRLVTGVVNPFTRGPGVLAQTAAALQEASGGRFVLGLGASSDVIVERFNDRSFERPLSAVREAVERLRPVLQTPDGRGFGGLRLERPPPAPIPIVLAALRGTMLALAGEMADGAFTNFLPRSGLEQVVAALREGERAAGRPPGAVELACRFFLVPGPPDQGLAFARHMFAAYASVPVYTAFFQWLGWSEQIADMVAAYVTGDRDRAAALAPEELIREVFVFGSPREQRERLLDFAAGGIETLVLTFIAPAPAVPDLIEHLSPRAWE
ncbi:MAG TPA: LLM class flavin-dependent oxidoreductase [Solirubrobacteraceae bacterium]